MDLIKPDIRQYVATKQAGQAKTSQPVCQFDIGQEVIAHDYRGAQKWVPGVIHAKTGPLSYQVEVAPNTIWRRHCDQLVDADVQEVIAPSSGESDNVQEAPSENNLSTSSMSEVPQMEQIVEQPAEALGRRYPVRARKAPDRLDL